MKLDFATKDQAKYNFQFSKPTESRLGKKAREPSRRRRGHGEKLLPKL